MSKKLKQTMQKIENMKKNENSWVGMKKIEKQIEKT